MIVFCDRLNLKSCKKAALLARLSGFIGKPVDLRVLDPLSSDLKTRILLLLLKKKINVREVQFIAGRLLMPDGQPVYVAARRLAHDVAFLASRRLLERSPLLSGMNNHWGRNTIMLYLAKFLWAPVHAILIRILVAERLLDSSEKDSRLIIAIPNYLDPDLFVSFSSRFVLEHYHNGFIENSIHQIYGLLWLVRQKFWELKWYIENIGKNRFYNLGYIGEKPTLLTIQEDEVSSDRSYRTQPHWLDPAEKLPFFRTLILKIKTHGKNGEAEQDLEGGIVVLPMKTWSLYGRSRKQHPVAERLSNDLSACIRASLSGSEYEKAVMFPMIKLLYTARSLAFLCMRTNVKVFMTCENYYIYSDAMQIVASPLSIRTLSFQYSNMGKAGPLMLTTADIMVTFSRLYHERWTRRKEKVEPGSFIDVGYVYDGSFKYVKKRAKQHRKQLLDAGAIFIICFYDENAFKGKYELVTQEDLLNEMQLLMEQVIDDPSLGLIFKNQFQWNAVGQFKGLSELRKKALSTGRYIELSHGSVRNTVFPAEAALAADMAIGHVIGATAPLEAALTGTRTILLNPYGMKNENDILYEQADIVYPTMRNALDAIHEFRDGNITRSAIGDWMPILHHFDPFRDGKSDIRMRNLLANIILDITNEDYNNYGNNTELSEKTSFRPNK